VSEAPLRVDVRGGVGTCWQCRSMRAQRVLTFVWLVLSGLAVEGAQAGEGTFGVVTLAGPSEVYKKSGTAWIPATLRAELGPGEGARTLEGRLTLRAASSQALRLAPSSRVSLVDAGAADQPTRVRLDGGSIWVAVMPASPAANQIEIETAAVTVAVKGGGVGITLARDGAILVRVHHGTAECSGPGRERQWSKSLSDQQEILLPNAGQPGEVRKLVRDKLDQDWIKWNEDQDLAGGYGGKPPTR
jgi:hypothetical protein